jgi:hypothetical protein
MTDDERYIAQGRARDAAKQLKADIATLQASFQQYGEWLQSLAGLLPRFFSNPAQRAPDGRPIIDHVNAFQQKYVTLDFLKRHLSSRI